METAQRLTAQYFGYINTARIIGGIREAAKPSQEAAKGFQIAAKGFQLAAKCFQLAAKPFQLAAKCSQLAAKCSQKMAGGSQKMAKCFQKVAKCSQKMIFWMPKMAHFDHPSAGLLWTDAFPPLSASGEPSGSPPASNQNQTRQNQDS